MGRWTVSGPDRDGYHRVEDGPYHVLVPTSILDPVLADLNAERPEPATVGPTDDRCAGGEPHLQRCLDGDCENSEAVVEALMEVGGWDDIDGEGTNATVLADHVRRLVPERDEPTAQDVFTWLVRNSDWGVDDSDDYVQEVLDARAALLEQEQGQ